MFTIGMYGIDDTRYGKNPVYTHDHGIAIMKDGKVLTAIELERYTGVKHDNRLSSYITELLTRYVPEGEEVRFVSANSFMGNTVLSRDGNFRLEPTGEVTVENILTPGSCLWYPDGMNRHKADSHIICHEFAHLAALLPFVGEFKPNSLLVHIDGGASLSSSSFWYYNGDSFQCLRSSWEDLVDVVINFNVNPLPQFFLGLLPEHHLSMPGKLMGYAAFGRENQEVDAWMKENGWGLGYKGTKEEMLQRINQRFSTSITGFDTRERLFMDMASSIQRLFEKRIISHIEKYTKQTGATTLYYAGGAALNITLNSILEKAGMFEDIIIPPSTNDSGLALGAAAWLEYLDNGRLSLHEPFLNKFDVPNETGNIQDDLDRITNSLRDGQVIGICEGASEIGPRALGHRSILGLGDSIPLRKRMSETIKKREWYRPIAPILCSDAADEVFAGELSGSSLARYMLGSYDVPMEWHEKFAGVMHVDGSVRAQVVYPEDTLNKNIHTLLTELWEGHGIPGLINTSFNIRGQPILHHHAQAVALGTSMGLDGVILNGTFLEC